MEQLSQEKQQLLHLLEEPASMEVQVRLWLGGLGTSSSSTALSLIGAQQITVHTTLGSF